jgi:ABC-type transport system involved in multi-copper enzyme maturation permease subunit
MVKAIVGVVVGYLAMAILIFLFFTVAYLSMGANRAFNPGSFDPTLFWIVISFFLSFVSALVGGYTCVTIAKSKRAAQVLAGLVLVLGIIVAIPVLTSGGTRPNNRPGDVSNMEAMQKARTPGWVALMNPLIGAVGVMVGAGLRQARTGRD